MPHPRGQVNVLTIPRAAGSFAADGPSLGKVKREAGAMLALPPQL